MMDRRSFIEAIAGVMASVSAGIKGLFISPDQPTLAPPKVYVPPPAPPAPRKIYQRYLFTARQTHAALLGDIQVFDYHPTRPNDSTVTARALTQLMHLMLLTRFLPRETGDGRGTLWDFSLTRIDSDELVWPAKTPYLLETAGTVNFFGASREEMMCACGYEPVLTAITQLAAGFEPNVGGINFYQLPQWSKQPYLSGKHMFAPGQFAIQHHLPPVQCVTEANDTIAPEWV